MIGTGILMMVQINFGKNNMHYHNHCRECYKIIDGKKYDIKNVEKESEVKYYH